MIESTAAAWLDRTTDGGDEDDDAHVHEEIMMDEAMDMEPTVAVA